MVRRPHAAESGRRNAAGAPSLRVRRTTQTPAHDGARPWGASAHCVVVIGEFDGMHAGHRSVLDVAVAQSLHTERPLVGVVIDDRAKPLICQPIADRCSALLRRCTGGVCVIEVSGAVAGLYEAAGQIAHDLEPALAVIGCQSDQAEPPLASLLRSLGLDVLTVDLAAGPTPAPTSEVVRAAIRRGDVVAAKSMLGRPFRIAGRVVRGRGLGHTIGFATANLEVPARQLVPALGVYSASALLSDRRRFPAAVNVGRRPTIEDCGRIVVEAHLIGFDGDLYGSTISIDLDTFLREERRFDSVESLASQLRQDIRSIAELSGSTDSDLEVPREFVQYRHASAD